MDNQQSPAVLLPPTIPSNWTPTGDWAAIFNSFCSLFLANTTVNIPGLGEVTPTQITAILASIQAIQNQINALAINIQTGTLTPSVGSVAINNVTFPTAMPNANYIISIVFVTNGVPTAVDQAWTLVSGSQSTTGFSFYTFLTAGEAISQINYTVYSVTSTT